MDRLPLVVLFVAVAVTAGCDKGDGQEAPKPAMSRVNAVQSKPQKRETPQGFCDLYPAASKAPRFRFPKLAEPAGPAQGGWRWINVWATWCKPCIKEMPMLEQWQRKLEHKGVKVELVYLSVDSDLEGLASFRKQHGGPTGPRIEGTDGLEKWLTTVGLDASAAIPIHFFVDPSGKIRCVRSGGLSSHHYPVVERMLASR